MKLKKTTTVLIAILALFAFAIVSTTPVFAASKKKNKAADTVDKVKKKTKKKVSKTKKDAKKTVKKKTDKAKKVTKKKTKKVKSKAKETTKTLPKGKININKATQEELMTLPGIGEVKAKAIMKARKKGKLKGLDDVMGVEGIGEETLKKLKPYLKF